MTIQEAVIELRKAAGKSQQVLATELQIATKTLQNYEQGRVPAVRQLLAMAARADALDRDDLWEVFMGDALMEQITPPPGWEVEIKFRRSPKGKQK